MSQCVDANTYRQVIEVACLLITRPHVLSADVKFRINLEQLYVEHQVYCTYVKAGAVLLLHSVSTLAPSYALPHCFYVPPSPLSGS